MNISRSISKAIERMILREVSQPLFLPEISSEWKELEHSLNKAEHVIDLGCGGNPHPKATIAVDAFLKPEHRALGQGPVINSKTFRDKGVHFVQAELSSLPFCDKEFDFAYSHHAFEHLSDPKNACMEMCRIARAGVIIAPSVFAEFAFGRPYHLWFVVARGNRLIFIRKTDREDRPFGDHPKKDTNGKFIVTPESNPFDILLNDKDWYKGGEKMPRLSTLIRRYWYSHSPVMEVVFLWEDSFRCTVIREDGTID